MKICKTGFLLFEVMVTVAILSLGLVFILQSFTSSLRVTRTSQNYTKALFFLEEKLIELEIDSQEKGGLPAGELSGENSGIKWEIIATKLEDLPLNEVRLAVFWQEGKRNQKMSLVTYSRNKETE